MKPLDLPAIFKSDAEDIIKAREDAIRIHGTNIRAAGDEIELSVRDYLIRMLPPRYYVSQGHLIDKNGNASSQLDVIVSDNFNLPSLMTTKDGTRYIPIDSVYSVGEIKSTYYHANKPIEAFSEKIKDIKENLYHPDILNTAYEGVNDDTLVRDIILDKGNRILNQIFYFAIFVSSGDFKLEDISKHYTNQEIKFLPNLVVLLNKGILLRASFQNDRFKFNLHPEDPKNEEEDWFICPIIGADSGSIEGNHLGFLYYSLMEHLANSYLDPPSLEGYLSRLMIGRKSQTQKITPP